MVRKTRKGKSKVKKTSLTIPELRKAFVHVEQVVMKKVQSLSQSEGLAYFRKEWKKLFGKEVSEHAAKDYIEFVSKVQKGGAQTMTPAPIGYDLQAGADAPVSSVPYISSGFGFANMDSISARCGQEDITPIPKASGLVGGRRKTRKQKGGAAPASLYDVASAFLTRPVTLGVTPTSSAPPSTPYQMQMNALGGVNPPFASSHAEIPAFNLTKMPPIYTSRVASVN